MSLASAAEMRSMPMSAAACLLPPGLQSKAQTRHIHRHSTVCRATDTSSSSEALLDRFWLSRGVHDNTQRRQLVDVALSDEQPQQLSSNSSLVRTENSENNNNGQLQGVSYTWGPLDSTSTAQVAEISRRVLALRQLLGGKDDIDIVWMIEREPDLLTVDIGSLTRRLVELRTSDAGAGLDVVKLAEAQPSLLLQIGSPDGSMSDEGETAEQRQAAWSYGLLGDGDVEWTRRLGELATYKEIHGDCHVGHRDGDDPSLVRWASKQREEQKQGIMAQEREEKLLNMEFEFNNERAEWLRWFNQLKKFEAVSGHCAPEPLAAGSDFLLLNWCSVQRIAKRSKVMAEDREAMLTALGFDWSGADALS